MTLSRSERPPDGTDRRKSVTRTTLNDVPVGSDMDIVFGESDWPNEES